MEQVFFSKNKQGFDWLDITAPSAAELKEMGIRYSLPANLVEDCLQPEHLPKFERTDDVIFIILRLYDTHAQSDASSIHEISRKIAVFVRNDTLITIHRSEQPMLVSLRERYAKSNGKLNRVLFSMIDMCFLTYEEPMMRSMDEIDLYESQIFLKKKNISLFNLYYIKRRVTLTRRIIDISHDILERLDNQPENKRYMQDLRDTFVKVETLIHQLNENVNSLMNIYLNISSQRTNEVMRILTVFSVFFMPLTFIVGIYGMNFNYMPELSKEWGYPAVMIGMAVITLLIFIWFKRKKWL